MTDKEIRQAINLAEEIHYECILLNDRIDEGFSKAEAIKIWNLSKQSIIDWVKDHPEDLECL